MIGGKLTRLLIDLSNSLTLGNADVETTVSLVSLAIDDEDSLFSGTLLGGVVVLNLGLGILKDF